MKSSAFKVIKNRRSVRKFKKNKISKKILSRLIEAARWAPSGLNNQPWKFKIVTSDGLKNKLGSLTSSKKIIKDADALICVFLDKKLSYNRDKDFMAIGASIQNILLSARELNVGTCWLGEILNRKAQAGKVLEVPTNLELCGVVALGYPISFKNAKSSRIATKKIIVK